MHKHSYDAVVAGGSFAGLACAQSMSRAGVQTLVLEKKPWPGTRTHTTGILVKELVENWSIPQRLVRRIDSIRLYSPGLDHLDLVSPEYYFYATDTPGLLRWHAERAIQSGTTIRYSTGYSGSRWNGVVHELAGAGISSRYLVGCDGARSRVAQCNGLGTNSDYLLGCEYEVTSLLGLPDNCLHVFLDDNIARGYIAWVVPGVHAWQVGLATRYPGTPDVDRFLARVSGLLHVDPGSIRERRAGLIPCGGMVERFYRPGILLLGDAAGMVSPLTAGGIHPAITIAGTAGSLIAEHLLYGGPDPGRVLQHELPTYFFKKKLRFLYNHLPFANTVYNGLLRTPMFKLVAQAVFFHNRGLFSLDAWRDIIRASLEH